MTSNSITKIQAIWRGYKERNLPYDGRWVNSIKDPEYILYSRFIDKLFNLKDDLHLMYQEDRDIFNDYEHDLYRERDEVLAKLESAFLKQLRSHEKRQRIAMNVKSIRICNKHTNNYTIPMLVSQYLYKS